MSKKPEYNVLIRGDQYQQNPPRYRYRQVGVAWKEENGITIKIDFPSPFLLQPDSVLRLFDITEVDNFTTPKRTQINRTEESNAISDEDIPF